MKEVKLTEAELLEIKSIAVTNWVSGAIGESLLASSIIEAFINYCNSKGYIIKDGKILDGNYNGPKKT